MPLYEYECDRGHRFERIVKFSDPPIETCPECGAPVHKLMSSPAIQFKGTGWYITDYARKSGDPSSKSGEAKSGETKSSDSKESKDVKSDKPAASSDTSSSSSSTSSTTTTSAKTD
jgi:putative FmdB family regulatory protein